MTPYFFLAGFALGILLTIFRHPVWGLYTYFFTFYLAPGHVWWDSLVPDIRYMLIVGVITVAVAWRSKDLQERTAWHQTYIAKILIIWVLYNWLQVGWAVDRDMQIEGATMFTKHLIAFYLIYKFANSKSEITKVVLINIVGCAWFGYQALGAGGGRLESIGGAVAGANELGVHLSWAIMMTGAILLTSKMAQKLIAFTSAPLILNCLILTISRGAFLGLVAAGTTAFFGIPRKFRAMYVGAGLLGLLLFSMLAHDQLIERFSGTVSSLLGSSEVESLDNSASMRIEIAKAGLEIALDHPFGVGYKGTGELSPMYMDESILTKRDGERRAHNTTMAVMAENGFIGLSLYYLMVLWVIVQLWRIRANRDRIDSMLAMSIVAQASGYIGIFVSGNFSNNIDLETQYWALAILCASVELAKAQSEQNSIKKQNPRGEYLPVTPQFSARQLPPSDQ